MRQIEGEVHQEARFDTLGDMVGCAVADASKRCEGGIRDATADMCQTKCGCSDK